MRPRSSFVIRHSSFLHAFTLIEMLVVIAIIGILASLIVGLAGRSSEQKIRKRAEAENQALVMAINVYKEKLGYFPQDGYQGANRPNYSPLYYELTKTPIPDALRAEFGNIKGIGNTGTKSEAFLTEVKAGQYRDEPNGVRHLTYAYGFAPWRYNATSPTNNPDSFDLWVEIDMSGKKMIIGNWKD